MSEDEFETCERCERDALPEDIETIVLDEEHHVCYSCVERLTAYVERYDWMDRYTEEQHERAVSLLSERDEIDCVIESYDDGQIVVHTPYVSSEVITDFCEHFGFRIGAFYPRWEQDSPWPCRDDHGSTFEIVLEYTHHCPQPNAPGAIFHEPHLEDVDGNDKQF